MRCWPHPLTLSKHSFITEDNLVNGNNNSSGQLSLPDWYPVAFSHLDAVEYGRVAQLWQNEPVLRELATALDQRNPGLITLTQCPHCHSTDICPGTRPEEYRCRACQRCSSPYTHTPFFDLHHVRHSRLYAVLVTLWGTWREEDAAWLSDCKSKQIWKQYCQRLKPILALLGHRPVTPQPRYLRGFTPGQQGIHCPACNSTQLAYSETMPVGNPEVHCQVCQADFVMYPDIPKGVDPFAANTPQSDIPVPQWFSRLFTHATQAQYQHLREVWQREPVLREAVERLDAQNPEQGAVYACPYCQNKHIRPRKTVSSIEGYYCPACDNPFTATTGTLFSRMRPEHFWRLYAVLVMLWTQWRPTQVFALCGLRSVSAFLIYHKRLGPLLEEFTDTAVTPTPRNLLGFTPGQQGVHCVNCLSTHLITEGITVMPLDNPNICCLDCGHKFMLRVWWQQAVCEEPPTTA